MTNGKRKAEHLQIAISRNVAFRRLSAGFEAYRFVHQALPELDLAQIDLSVELLGKRLSAPIVISPMIGGIPEAQPLNRALAEAAQQLGLAMGVGSQRCAIEDPRCECFYQLRTVAPDILLFANLGAVQLNYGYGIEQCRRAVEMAGADALVLHLNPLQEALQPEGNCNFRGLLGKIASICRQLAVPVIAREVGWGISQEAAQRLAEAGVSGIDVAGAGGTSWSRIEGLRGQTRSARNIAAAFADWGIPTSEAIGLARAGRGAAADRQRRNPHGGGYRQSACSGRGCRRNWAAAAQSGPSFRRTRPRGPGGTDHTVALDDVLHRGRFDRTTAQHTASS